MLIHGNSYKICLGDKPVHYPAPHSWEPDTFRDSDRGEYLICINCDERKYLDEKPPDEVSRNLVTAVSSGLDLSETKKAILDHLIRHGSAGPYNLWLVVPVRNLMIFTDAIATLEESGEIKVTQEGERVLLQIGLIPSCK